MSSTFWILIILGANGPSSVATTNFDNMLACISAKQQVEAYRGVGGNLYQAICTPSFVKKSKD